MKTSPVHGHHEVKVLKHSVAVLISGNGSNLQALIDACGDPAYPARIDLVISNTPDAFGLVRAKNSGIKTITIDNHLYPTRQAFEDQIHQELMKAGIKFICLAGFMRILSSPFVQEWEGRILNIHPSLLPAHGGLHGIKVHKSVLDKGDTISGATVHLVTAQVDAGEIVLQDQVHVEKNDSPESLAQRVLQVEHKIYPKALKMLIERVGFLDEEAS